MHLVSNNSQPEMWNLRDSRSPGFIDIAMHVMEAINSPQYNVTEWVGTDGASTFRIHLKDAMGGDGAMVAVVTYNPKRGTVLLQQVHAQLASAA